ncbi:hypothetical protein NC651_023757 [Populus alba x Populus x berolinensis]|nr:hypothetical protein NC651_023757 [Populus alba x Populus x berolinensis]
MAVRKVQGSSKHARLNTLRLDNQPIPKFLDMAARQVVERKWAHGSLMQVDEGYRAGDQGKSTSQIMTEQRIFTASHHLL